MELILSDKLGFINFFYQLNQLDHPTSSSCATLFSASIFFFLKSNGHYSKKNIGFLKFESIKF